MKDMQDGLRELDLLMRQTAEKALAQAGMRLLKDCMMEVPKVPHDEGTLRGSGSVHINGIFIASSEEHGGPKGKPTPMTENFAKQLAQNEIAATVAFNTPYASHLHEHPEYNFTEAGCGGKYMERKLYGNADRYARIIQRVFREALKNG